MQAFNQGDLTRARLLLEQALSKGLESASLRYNLGVVYYRLELYDRSREQFRILLDTPHRDLALYNLGLISQAEEDHRQARDYFTEVAEHAEQEKLRKLALLQLEDQADTRVFPAPWSGFASLGPGYEDNLALLPDDAATDLSDTFNDGFVVAAGPLWELNGRADRADSINLSGSAFRRHYHSESDYSNDALQAAVSWVSRGRTDRYQFGLQQSWFRIGGENREFHTTLDLKYRKAGCLGVAGGRCDLGANLSLVNPSDGFEAYEGTRYFFQGGYLYQWDQWEAHSRIRLEFNDRDDLRQGDQFISVSPRRQELEAGLDFHGFGQLSVGGWLGFRYSDYPDDYELLEASGVEAGRRTEQRYSVSLRSDYALSSQWSVSAEAIYRRNDSSLEQFTYDNYITQLSLGYLF
ncbi:hypothetical protein [Marinobacter sp.]|uniref:tetratricopeptide repeat protein n=1 Tax=Marinobacter sp. TaxID=50741 RepID=UPI0038505AEB